MTSLPRIKHTKPVPGPDPSVPMLALGAGVLFYAVVLFLLIKWGMK